MKRILKRFMPQTILLVLVAVFAVAAVSVFAAVNGSTDNKVDLSLVMTPETQLTVYVDGQYSGALSESYGFGDTASITAPSVSGKVFSHWEADGSIISYSNPLKLTMNAHTTLYAVYTSTAETEKPVSGFTSITRTNEGDKISFQAIAGGGTVEGAGIVYSTTASGETLKIGGTGVMNVAAVKSADLGNKLPDSVLDDNNCWMLQITPDGDSTVYHARTYVTVGGNTTYGDMKDVKLSELESGISMIANLEGFEPGTDDLLEEIAKNRANNPASVTNAPTAKNLTYNGSAQELVTAGTATGGEMQYALGTDATTAPANNLYTTSIPTATDAGTYYVWYKVVGDANHNDVAHEKVSVSIGKADATITAKDQTIKEGESVAEGTGNVEVSGLLTGHSLDTISLESGTGETAGKVIASDARIKDGNNQDVTSNYTVVYTPGTLTVRAALSRTVTFKVVNGSWNDETATDKTVTLTGYEGDTLKLAASQIPAVGTKPNDTYKAGSWDVTPSADTAITADTTYIYTYAQKDTISRTVTFKVVNGSWNDETATDKTVTLTGYEGDTLKLAANQIPTVGTKPNDTYKAGSWDTTPSADTEITEATTYTYTYAQKDSISRTVTFKVVNGSWNDETTTDKTVTLTGYEGDTLKLTADQIPTVGTKPNDTYKAGSWDVMPNTDTAITEATTYTYTYVAKEASVVTKAPEAKTLTYNGQAQELVTAGTATGGEMQYALGNATEATQPYTTSIPTATDAGTYYVWYKVIGDENHSDFTADQAVLVEIKADTAAPTGEISIDTNKWASFLNTITFGFFFRETKEVKITASDDLSGVGKIEYYIANAALSQAQAEAVTDWKTYDSAFNLNPENKYVVYARITDKAGNTTYLSSDGLVFVNLPVGYVTDIGVDSAKLNMKLSDPVRSEIKAAGFEYKKKADADTAWTKVAADSVTETVTKEIASLTAGTDYVFRPYVTYTNDSMDTGAEQNFTTDTKPAVTGSIDVKVKNDTDEKKDVVVTIEEGNNVLASREYNGIEKNAEVTTGKFKELPDGTYNIVIKSKEGEFVETKMITIANGASETISFTISKGEMKTDVEVEADTPKVAVDGLSKEELVQSGTITPDEKTKVESGEISLEVTLKAEKKETSKVETKTVSAIQQVMAESSTKLVVDMFLDLSLFKTVTQLTGDQAGKTDETDIGSTNTKVLEIAVPYDTTIKGLMVYRYHGSAASALKKLSSAPAKETYEDGSFYLSDKYIHIFASGFSTYAIAKEEESSSGGGGGTTPVTPGKTTPAKPSAPVLDKKTDTTITVKTVAGQEYSIDGGKTWQTSGTFTGLTPETEYSIVTKITATGTANESPVSDALKVTTDKKADSSTPASQKDKVTKTEKAAAKISINAGLKVSQSGKKVTVKWGKVSKADRYVVYASYCGPDKCTKIKALSGSKTSMTFTKLNGSKLNLKKNVKVYVVAYRKVNGKETKLARSITAHIVGSKNAKYTNVKKIKLSKSKYTLKANKTATIKAKIVLVDKKKKQLSDSHAPEFRYASSNTKVATVDKNGKITAVKKGTCYIYVYAKNGYAKKVKVTVK